MTIRRDFPDLPPLWTLGAIVSGRIVAALLPWPGPARPGAKLLGAASIAAGAGLACWSALWFWGKRTTIEPREKPSALIVEGPFRLNRNPIYTGMILVAVGAAVRTGSATAFAAALVLPVVLDRRFVRNEEADLRDAFGEDAEAYFARTRRW